MSSDDVISLRTPWTTSLESPGPLERRLSEQRLHAEQLQLLGTAVHVSSHGIAFLNDGFCTLYGRGRDEIIGQTPVAFGIVERQEAIFVSLLQHVFEHRAFAAEATAQRMDGSEFEL